jgi:hypothetical protein
VKVSRPSFVPFWGTATIDKHVPLSMVIDIIIEQGTDAGLFRCFSCYDYEIIILGYIVIGCVPMQCIWFQGLVVMSC